MKHLKLLFLLGFILLFTNPKPVSAEVMDYANGYSDGCNSAKGNFKKSSRAYKNNPTYRNGWKNGYKECKKDIEEAKKKARTGSKKYTEKKKKVRKRRVRRVRVRHTKRRIKIARKRSYREYEEVVYTHACKQNPWLTFSQGWDDGYSSAQGYWIKRDNNCPSYIRGWEEGYNHCKCQEFGECITLSTVDI